MTTTTTIALIAAAVVLFVALMVYIRRPRLDQGLDSWRKHIDALSPEARRQVIDRVRGPESRDRQSTIDDHKGEDNR